MAGTTSTPRRSDRTRAAILAAARKRFTAEGYERATIRAIAADAAIDPSMVMRYFGSKEQLFSAAADIDLRLPDLSGVPREELGRAIVEHFFTAWEGVPDDDAFLVLLRSAVTNEKAAERTREIFRDQVRPALMAVLGEEGAERASLVSCQLLGLALGRYLIRLPGVSSMSADQVVDGLSPCIQTALTG
ncbi:TetR/AcrR family transcriptional regulator [Wenjunlia tyrosinilytica]|jgi:AcrR family transcriptional regulator|uniref:TetR family transcriptional regulator n=1 Tax=Wenjunlia tyrosinilytica TaxID=1544741 RepID=A0A917ZUG2_9ACTN|nr:TetR family transcriptional regulator [Wenjunlia tyrosinilytica]GGO92454.1 TetR family transcriptional regulator [Wenjunlia tyrosinilytica]